MSIGRLSPVDRSSQGPAAQSPTEPAPARWVRPAVAALLLTTAVLYTWRLSDVGWGNSYYAAAAQAGSQSWSAWFFGAFDAAGAITVDKTPASLWVMGLSARLFGVNSWSIMLPQAAMGVAAVALLHAMVARRFGPVAGLIAGAAAALTPVAALMFRYNQPDALLALVCVAAAWATLRALEAARTRWLVLAGVLVGIGFMTKMLQVALVVPALAVTYLVAAPTTLRRRLTQLAVAGGAMLVSGGWWVAVVTLVATGSRPYVGGSKNDSVLELALGYNGLERLDGTDLPGTIDGISIPAGAAFGQPGLDRLLDVQNGGQAGWLLPAAVVLLAAGLWISRRSPRVDPGRAAVLLWGIWLLTTALVFSFMEGIFHEYYSVALAAPIGALVGSGAVLLWRHRDRPAAHAALTLLVAGTVSWSYVLLRRAPQLPAGIGTAVLVAGLLTAAAIAVPPSRARGRIGAGIAVAGVAACLAGPSVFVVATLDAATSGPVITAGPLSNAGRQARLLITGGQPPEAVIRILTADTGTTWAAATVGARDAATYQLATGRPVLMIGGFAGIDPSPTLAEFQDHVAAGRIRYLVATSAPILSPPGTGPGAAPAAPAAAGPDPGATGTAGEITRWVRSRWTPIVRDGVTLYDLAAAPRS